MFLSAPRLHSHSLEHFSASIPLKQNHKQHLPHISAYPPPTILSPLSLDDFQIHILFNPAHIGHDLRRLTFPKDISLQLWWEESCARVEIGLGRKIAKVETLGNFTRKVTFGPKLWNMSKILQAEISKISSKEKNSGQKNVCQNRPKSIYRWTREKEAISHFELGC